MSLCLTALSLCLGLAFGAPRADPELDGHWQLWKSWHNKDYHEVSARRRALSAASPPVRSAGPCPLSHVCLLLARAALGRDDPPLPGPLAVSVRPHGRSVLCVLVTAGAAKRPSPARRSGFPFE